MATIRPHTTLVMARGTFERQFGPEEYHRLESLATLGDPAYIPDLAAVGPERLALTEVLLTSWGCPPITDTDLDAMPRLRAVLHAAGSVRALLPPSVHSRGIAVATAAEQNAVPVAEYTLAAVILAGKRALPLAAEGRLNPGTWESSFETSQLSNHGRRIGLVGFSKIGRRVLELLRVLDHGPILVADPMADPAEVRRLGGELAPLDVVLAQSEILSLHAPLLPETQGMIGADQLAQMPAGGTLINTARGALVDHEALLSECASGRLDAILDVTDPEPLPAGHPLLALPNVTVTPHLAGSLGTETRRLTQFTLDGLEAFVAGQPVPGAVTDESAQVSA
ncbi:hydroxyacid dehydrogenase [Ruania halotolerans]|uniref:hydroxyacid dehydrogenase n=1 Tax=Ruania halotolerans TaxID=2897773 RepID=UPI001E341EB5|nr:hydroxyacid dehydrogenase [Ruania halotolerans]UFU06775.1 hydroxyacid dehydrogenase [Ruania halotolerans]